jgi:hypothetical protein
MNKIIAKFYDATFEFTIKEKSEGYCVGFLAWTKEDKLRLKVERKKHSKEADNWYLDKDGYRLEDEQLFEKSPWTIIEIDKEKK